MEQLMYYCLPFRQVRGVWGCLCGRKQKGFFSGVPVLVPVGSARSAARVHAGNNVSCRGARGGRKEIGRACRATHCRADARCVCIFRETKSAAHSV